MNLQQWPGWAWIFVGVLAVVAGGLGVVHAPPAVGKATWAIIAGLGVAAVVWGVRSMRRASKR